MILILLSLVARTRWAWIRALLNDLYPSHSPSAFR